MRRCALALGGTEKEMNCDVIIVGGGLGGFALAKSLSEKGMSVLLV